MNLQQLNPCDGKAKVRRKRKWQKIIRRYKQKLKVLKWNMVKGKFMPLVQIFKGFSFTYVGIWYYSDEAEELMIMFFLIWGILNFVDNFFNGYDFDYYTRNPFRSSRKTVGFSSIEHLMFNTFSAVGLFLAFWIGGVVQWFILLFFSLFIYLVWLAEKERIELKKPRLEEDFSWDEETE